MSRLISCASFLSLLASAGLLVASGMESNAIWPAPVPVSCAPSPWEKAKFDPRRFIAHAAGAIGEETYTNSQEALDESYRRGYRLLEVDLITTKDGTLVAAHDWNHWRKITGSELIHPTLDEFVRMPILGRFTPMTVRDLEDWFERHSDAALVTDKTESFGVLVAEFRHRDRLMVEVSSYEAYDRAIRAGVLHPILSVQSATSEAGLTLRAFLETRNVRFLSVPAASAHLNEQVLRELRRAGRCVYGHSSNETAFIRRALEEVLFGVYTDTWHPAKGAAEPEGPTY